VAHVALALHITPEEAWTMDPVDFATVVEVVMLGDVMLGDVMPEEGDPRD
jgi:hypothetical protein